MQSLRSIRFGALSALALFAGACSAAPILEVNPGLWASDSEIWINGQSMKPGLTALRAKLRSRLTDAQKAEMDKQQAAEKQACLTPQQSKIDLAAYLESALSGSGPWKCELSATKMNTSEATGKYACRTSGGGHTQGRFEATYGPTSYRIELNGRGNAVDGRTGDAISADEMEQRMLSTGRWLGSSC
ncbi:MAG TPA: DUF3617 family protein [Roseateles sp.]